MQMHADQVFVFTPKGDLVALPNGAMPLDFAFSVHSDIGSSCIGVKINNLPFGAELNLQVLPVEDHPEGPVHAVRDQDRRGVPGGVARVCARRDAVLSCAGGPRPRQHLRRRDQQHLGIGHVPRSGGHLATHGVDAEAGLGAVAEISCSIQPVVSSAAS